MDFAKNCLGHFYGSKIIAQFMKKQAFTERNSTEILKIHGFEDLAVISRGRHCRQFLSPIPLFTTYLQLICTN